MLPTREDKMREKEYGLARKIKTLLEDELGYHEVADVAFNYDRLDDGFLTIHVDFYDEPKDIDK